MIPRFTRVLEDRHVRESDFVEFICGVYPENSPVTWTMNGSDVLPDSAKVDVTSVGGEHRLTIKSAIEPDAGFISASLGENESHAELTVEGRLKK